MFSQYLNREATEEALEGGDVSPIRYMPYDLVSLQYLNEPVCCLNGIKEAYAASWSHFGLTPNQIIYHLQLTSNYSELNTFIGKANYYRSALPHRTLPEEINLHVFRYLTYGVLQLRRLLRYQTDRNFGDIFTDISAEKFLAIKTIIFSQFLESVWTQTETLVWP